MEDPREPASSLELDVLLASLTRRMFDAEAPHPRVGRFEVIDKIGEGAMGRVFAAHDPELDRRVAIKILRTEGDDDERILVEARALANVSHPNVLTVFDVGRVEDGAFVAMEYAAGGTLRQWCEQDRRSWREVVALCLEAGRGLAAAHRAGIVHRDFKPDNVLLTTEGNARVADFGLAALPRPSSVPPASSTVDSVMRSQTLDGAWAGTPAYMAPEQLEGRSADPRADQFAFCVAVWELVHGERPFAGDTVDGLLAHVRAGETREPDGTEVPAWVRTVLMRGLHPEPDERYPSMQALLDALGAGLGGRARSRRLASVGVAGAVLVAAAAYVLSPSAQTEPVLCQSAASRLEGVWDEPSIAHMRTAFMGVGLPRADADAAWAATRSALDDYAARWTEQHTAACEATHVVGDQSAEMLDLRNECLGHRLEELSALVGVLRSPDEDAAILAPEAAQRLPGLAQCADTRALRDALPLPTDPEVRQQVASVRSSLARTRALRASGDYLQARREHEPLVEAARATSYAPVIAEALYADAMHAANDPESRVEVYRAAAHAAAEAHDDRLVALSYARLIQVVGYVLARHQDALELRPFAEAALARAGGEPEIEALLLNAVAIVLDEMGRYDEAMEAYGRSLQLRREALGEEHPDVAASLNNIGDSLRLQGRIPEALERLQSSLDMKLRTLGPHHPHIAYAAHNLGVVYMQLGRLSDARQHFEMAVAGNRAGSPDGQAVGAPLTGQLGYLAFLEGDSERALELLGDANRRFVPPSSTHPMAVDLARMHGEVLTVTGDLERGREELERASGLAEAVWDDDHPELARVYESAGIAALDRGERADATASLERAVAIYDANEYVDPMWRGRAAFALARALEPTDRARARDLAATAHDHLAPLGPRADDERRALEGWLDSR